MLRTSGRRLALGAAAAEGWGVNSGEELCLACGLCCDGALFGHVRLGPQDDAQKLTALGLPVSVVRRSRTAVVHFPQPCAALCKDRRCRVYADRPTQCRTFECGVFKEAQAGRIPFPVALRLVKRARGLANQIRRLLRELGDIEEHRSLSERFRRTQQRMESGGVDEAAAGAFAKLSVAVHSFDLLTHEKFHTKSDTDAR